MANLVMGAGYAFILPSVAVLHARAAAHRQSGSILATIAAAAAAIVGIGAAITTELRPAALILLGMWWWTVGKMGAETGILPRALGFGTATAGVAAFAAAAFVPMGPWLWEAARLALGVWLIALAVTFTRR
ncbi:MAG: hypothetical protein EXR61_01885 [Chloroflexi bacterium]|nr:hypothetical protein [Chloroflexota bacterium]